MWSLVLVFFMLYISMNSSSLLAISGLIFLAIIMGVKAGVLFSSWFFLTLMIIYVGGMMVMFLYLSNLISTFKTKKMSVTPSMVLSTGIFLVIYSGLSPGLNLESEGHVSIGLSFGNFPFLVFLVIYLFFALVMVFKICEKNEGPMKN